MRHDIVARPAFASLARLRPWFASALLLMAVLLYVLYPVTAALATSYHSITIDGVNDFAADEDVPGTSGSTWFFSWDATNFYVAATNPDVSSGNANKWVHLYLDSDPKAAPATGTGSAVGVTYNTQQPGLPFTANYHLRWKANNTFTELMVWNGSAWVSGSQTGVAAFQSGTFVEFRIPRANLGSPAALYVAGGMINEQGGGESTFFMTPSTNTPGYDANYTSYFRFGLQGGGVSPDAAANLACTPLITVTSTANSGAGTLRQAVIDGCSGGTITFAPALANQTITLTSGEIVINKTLTIDGAAAPGLKIDGNNASRLFNLNVAAGNLSLLSLTIQRGQAPAGSNGGAIFNQSGTVLISNTLVLSSTAQNGGGLRNQRLNTSTPAGVLTLVNSTVRGNIAINNGAGISTSSSTTSILNSAILGNTAQGNSATVTGSGSTGLGGGIHHVNGASPPTSWTTAITNTTIAGNQGNGGAAVYVDNLGRVELFASTVTGNAATNAATSQVGGVFLGNTGSNAQLLRLKNTLVANNSASNTATRAPDVGNATGLSITSGGYNLLESVTGATVGGVVTGNITGQDPVLGPLQNNGGPTLTQALLSGSPALNTGDPAFVAPPATDQRGPGFPRIQGGRLDIGAFESNDQVQTSSPFVVTSAADPGDGTCTMFDCTLREALTLTNTTPATDTIAFNIAGAGVQTITPLSPLPTVSAPVIIDGLTQPGAACGTPRIEINGSSAGASTSGLRVTAGSSLIRGLAINRFSANGIELSGSGGTTVQCNFIGTSAAGTADLGNALAGVYINGSANNLIGGTGATRNLLSGNNGDGVAVLGAGATGNRIQGNYIGTDAAGALDLGNASGGIYIFNIANTTVGGTTAGAGNVISGNDNNGVYIAGGSATGTLVAGNHIGLNAAGSATIGNAFNGVVLDGAVGSTIGGTLAGARNVISGNGNNGINITNAAASGNQIQGNYIGTDATGALDLGNGQSGVRISGASSNTVGGSTAGARNLIAGNAFNGVVLENGPASNNTVAGNYIGTNAAGTAAIPNSQNGVQLATGATANIIGGTTAGAGNLIAGNTQDGVNITTAGNTVAGNIVGLNAGGTAKLANGKNGIFINNAADNTLGGTAVAARNVISGNTLDGIAINGSSTGTLVQGNFIGTSSAGTAALGNTSSGVFIGTSASHTIGGTAAGAGNLIAGNTNGIYLAGAGSVNNQIQGNYIGTNAAGNAALGNTSNGIVIDGAKNNTVGGATPAARNLISGNGQHGINMFTIGTSGNQIQGNYIGTDASGAADLGNFLSGVRMFRASGNSVGGTAPGAGNLIAGNNQHGVLVSEVEAVGNTIQGNLIGTNASGTGGLANSLDGVRIDLNGPTGTLIGGNTIAFNGGRGINLLTGTGQRISGNAIFSNGSLGIDLNNDGLTANDPGDGDAGPNNLQNFPLLSLATTGGGTTGVAGTLNSAANTTFTLEFFSNSVCETSGFGEGRVFLGASGATTDGAGNAAFSAQLASAVPPGGLITATAIDSGGNTSEFSQCQVVSAAPTLSIGDVAVTEGNAGTVNAVFTVSLSGPSAQAITVDYATADGSAAQPADYAASSGSLALAPLQTSGTITVAVAGDLIDETDETFLVNLSNPANASLGDGQGVGTISDDDAPPTLSIGDVTVTEGNAGTVNAVFTVSIAQPSTQAITVDYATADGSAAQPADYAASGGSLVLAPLQTSATVTVAVAGDLLDEADETFVVNLSNPANASLGDGQGVGTISDDDGPPALSIGDVTLTEGNAGIVTAAFTVSLSAPSGQTVVVSYATADATATQPTDYIASNGSLTLAPLQTSATITVAVVGDLIDEADETFLVNLSNPANASLGDGQGVGTISNDDGIKRTFLPMLIRSGQADLVVESITASAAGVTIVIRNQGDAAVVEPFWVDGYVNPTTPPTAVNQTWDQLGTQGMVWGVEGAALPINPGEARTLTIGDSFYHPEFSNLSGAIAAGTPLYAQADSANATTSYGSVFESHEASGGPYNNILGPINATMRALVGTFSRAQPEETPARLPVRP